MNRKLHESISGRAAKLVFNDKNMIETIKKASREEVKGGLRGRSHHLNMTGPIPSQVLWAAYYLIKARKTKDLKYLGYGVHSLQDLVAHGPLPIHLSRAGGWVDTYTGLGREKISEWITEKYLRMY